MVRLEKQPPKKERGKQEGYMKYVDLETAKLLKEKGFPQGDWEERYSDFSNKYWSVYDGGAAEQNPLLIDASECNFGFMENLWAAPTQEEAEKFLDPLI